MIYTISTDRKVPLTLSQTNEVMDKLQQIALLISTKQGTCPQYRDFGIPKRFEGKPFNVAENIAMMEITEAINQFVPGVLLVDVRLKFSREKLGKYSLEVEVEI